MNRIARAALAAAIVQALPVAAQTVIVPDQGGAGIGTTVNTAARINTIRGGTLVGDNLFHSFTRFDLAAGDVARWVRGEADAGSIANIVNRVTGGDPSNIDGTLRVTDMPSAAFWFINPAGIVFGQGAAIDVPGAAYFATAASLNFADGASFKAVTPTGSTFSSAAPEAFGFLGGQGSITVTRADEQFTAATGSLALAAANIALDGSFASGALTLLAVGNASVNPKLADPLPLIGSGRIDIGSNAGVTDIDAGSYRFAGQTMAINNASLRAVTTDTALGPVTVQAGDLSFNGSRLTAVSKGTAEGSSIAIIADRLAMTASGVETLSRDAGSAGALTVTAKSFTGNEADLSSTSEASGDAGAVTLVARDIALSGDSYVQSRTLADSTGNAGRVSVDAAVSLSLAGSSIYSHTRGSGDAGAVEVRSAEVLMQDGRIRSDTFASGTAASVAVEADRLLLEAGSIISSSAIGAATGDAGSVLVDAGMVTVDRSGIATVSNRAAVGGKIKIDADMIVIDNGIIDAANGPRGGAAGDIEISANSLRVGHGQISSSTVNENDAGDVMIRVRELIATSDSIINSASNDQASGSGGNVLIEADSLTVDASRISASTFGTGDAGTVTVQAREVELTSGALLISLAGNGSSGRSGEVEVTADLLRIEGSDLSTSTFGAGDAGVVNLKVKMLKVVDQGRVSSTTSGDGDAGRIDVVADRVDLDKGFFATGTTAAGNAGTIAVNADDVRLANGSAVFSRANEQSSGNGGNIDVAATKISLDGSQIAANTLAAGNAGTITVTADELNLTNNSDVTSVAEAGSFGNGGQVNVIVADRLALQASRIAVSTFGPGDAGALGVQARDLVMTDSSLLASRAGIGSTGDAGPIAVAADTLRFDASGVSSSTLGSGDAGIVGVVSREITLSNNAFIASQTESTAAAKGGDIAILADVLRSDFSFVSASTLGAGEAGALAVVVRDIALANGSFLASQSTGSGSAGAVLVQADVLRADASELTSAAFAAGNAGTVDVVVRDMALTGGASINSTAATGSSGNAGDLNVRSDTLLLDAAEIDSSTFGPGKGGVVKVRAAMLTAINDSAIASAAGAGSTGKGGDTIVNADRLSLDGSVITSSTFGAGDAGIAAVVAKELDLTNFSRIETQAKEGSTGNAGGVGIDADVVRLDLSEINSNTFGPGNAGGVVVTADRLQLRNQSFVSSQASSGQTGSAGAVKLDVGVLDVAASQIDSATLGTGDAGLVAITATEAILRPGTFIASQTERGSTGRGGSVIIEAGKLSADAAVISSSTQGAGDGGSVEIVGGDITLSNGTRVVSLSTSDATGSAGQVAITAATLLAEGAGTSINSASTGVGDAGSIEIGANVISLLEGADITTNSAFGPAGDITLRLPQNGVLQLIGETPAVITTTSGPSTGGRITIADPYLILSHGGSILALGDQSGANVQISSDFYIRSADRPNLLSVNGSLLLDSQISDLSAGTEAPAIGFLDASSVLSGQCAAARSSGRTSRFTRRITGPYAALAPAPPIRSLPESVPPITLDARVLSPCG